MVEQDLQILSQLIKSLIHLTSAVQQLTERVDKQIEEPEVISGKLFSKN